MRSIFTSIFLGVLCVTTWPNFALQPMSKTTDLPGPKPDGSILLPNQWSLRPVGRQIELGNTPVNMAMHPDGRYIAILHCGTKDQEIVIVDLKTEKITSRQLVNDAFYGLEFSHSGSRLYCSGSRDETVHVYDFTDGALKQGPAIPLRKPSRRGVPSGLAISGDAQTLYAANLWGQTVSRVDLSKRTNLLEIVLAPDKTFAQDRSIKPEDKGLLDPDFSAIVKRYHGLLEPENLEAAFPYACRIDDRRHRLYVSEWAQACIAVIDTRNNEVITKWFTDEHPNEMLLTKNGKFLFVANANRNTVTVIDTDDGKTLQTLSSSFTPNQLPGSTPNSLALSPDENFLFVANADNNNIAVFDVSVVRKSHSLGFIPVGWYPTSVRVTPDGKHLLVASAKGTRSKANPKGPGPGKKTTSETQTISEFLKGSLSIIDLPKGKQFKNQLADWTQQAFLCTPQKSVSQAAPESGNPIPIRVGDPSPIKYVFYIVKENRTYDQVFGDLPQGNGDPKLCLFPEKNSPNHHRLVRDFVLLDNFYADAEVSADGHEWSMAAYATDFVEKTWPLHYRPGGIKKFTYPSEGRFPIAEPVNGYIWDRAREAGITYRTFGEFILDGPTPDSPNICRVPALKDHFDLWYRGFDMDYSDQKRADRFISELKRFDAEGNMPRLQIIRLPSDHTSGALPGRPTPAAYVADNDFALGRIVEAISHSKIWPQAAIFVVEDDAQNGPDHVDAHRTIAFAISPYIKHGSVDSTMYSTSSMLRTMELILGLKPMTQYDFSATPMYKSFQAQPDVRPYDCLPENFDLNEKNTKLSWGSKMSQKMNFAKEDAADDYLLNEIIWRSVRGANSHMPAPTRAAFVFAHPKVDDDD
ncbi:beta-propeller fold lactonase family protein [Pedosphaera parvula]|uniref:Phosphoesterase n=1 Tax=Pedosphaera parvula (strain Ellin514) TaxID=320771 RepID=B9XN10_PEDPL|nr:beta-propeller fold lactonase family protein [Pedosphaera parvula]EEF58806.1 phosphoesterase [Pedosphaera parvula Ellin514]